LGGEQMERIIIKEVVLKKLLAVVIFFSVILSFPTAVFANSGPVFWRGYPSSEVLSVEDNSPIVVQNENLIFDFSSVDNVSYTISGKVTATYNMINPTDELQSVQMAFPFVSSLKNIQMGDISVIVNGNSLHYDIYAGDVVDTYGNPWQEEKDAKTEFANIVSTISDKLYQAETFAEDEKGRLYTIKVTPTTDERINFAVDFNSDSKKTKVIASGFNRYHCEDEKTSIASWCREPKTLEIYVLGEDIDLKVEAFTDGQLKEKTDKFDYQVSTQEVEVKPYLMDYIIENSARDSMVDTIQLYNLYAKALDKYFKGNLGYTSQNDLRALEQYERIFTIIYTVEFPNNSEKEVSVSYNTSGTMDARDTAKPLYSFDYILNPAKSWSDFKKLNVEIITPEEVPYVAESSIELVKVEDQVYRVSIEGLPEDDLSFSLYAEEEVKRKNIFLVGLLDTLRFLKFPPVIGAIVLLIVGIIVVVISKRK
jgi:hypothetical protein